MIGLVPRYLQMLDPKEDRTRLMLKRLGLSDDELRGEVGGSVLVTVPVGATGGRLLLARQLIDLTLRLQPLVGRVYLDTLDAPALIGDIATRFPVDVCEVDHIPQVDVSIVAGGTIGSHDLSVDAAGWAVMFGAPCTVDDDQNPIGPLAGAAVAAGEVFKLVFAKKCPDGRIAKQKIMNQGPFSFWDYSRSQASPALRQVQMEALLVGCGGIGSAVVVAVGALGSMVAGTLQVVDHDFLDVYNLNRVSFARMEEAKRGDKKVDAAQAYLRARTPSLRVLPYDDRYLMFARRTPRREDRRYPLVMTGLDSDDVRLEVQRDLPRTLVDGATGTQANCVVEVVRFGASGCLGCSRPPASAPSQEPLHCDAAPEPLAPSISFLSSFAGTLVAGEAIKCGLNGSAARRFEHHFTYALNPDLRSQVGFASACPVGCHEPSLRDAFRRKWSGTQT